MGSVNNLEHWAARLRAATNRDAVPEIAPREGRLDVFVWSEATVESLYRTAGRLGIPEGVLHIIRPLAFLNPYPGNDPRNAQAHEEFIDHQARNVASDTAVLLTSMPAIVAGAPRVLVLGSMPGELSLSRGEYYANPQNRFWWLMGDILGVPQTATYEHRIEALTAAGVALWDVLKHCSRFGSLDRHIDPLTEAPNDFAEFFSTYPSVTRVVFNGQRAARSFRRLVAPDLSADLNARLAMIVAPSTSAANARMGRGALANAWRSPLS